MITNGKGTKLTKNSRPVLLVGYFFIYENVFEKWNEAPKSISPF
jgi:hypothetical protein